MFDNGLECNAGRVDTGPSKCEPCGIVGASGNKKIDFQDDPGSQLVKAVAVTGLGV
jgi:hypothetical protein